MRTVRWLAWSVGILFLLGTALQLVDTLNLYVAPPEPSGPLNMVESRLASLEYRSAIWPIFLLSHLSFGMAFVALVGLGLALASWLASGDSQRIVILTAFGVAGILGAVAQLIVIGAAGVTIDIAYCDCGFKETEIVSQIWGQMLIEGGSDWLLNVAGVLAAIGVLSVDASFRHRMSGVWDVVSWLTAVGLIASVAVGVLHLGDDLEQDLLLAVSGVLVPIWAIWLGASLRLVAATGPEANAEPGPA